MKVLLKNGTVVNVFTGELEKTNVLMDGSVIAGVGEYTDSEADVVRDVKDKYICPGFIDGHLHIESTMLLPPELARVCVPHGTTAVVTDPHEIANVCGVKGIEFMLEASENIPMTVYVMLPSCVPATRFDESGAVLTAAELEKFYGHPRVLGLAEVMNYPGVIAGEPGIMDKIRSAREKGFTVNGHAPLLSGKDLDRYIAAGIYDDHECSSADEAKERIRKGQRIMVRQGTAARNLSDLLPLFEEPWAHRCLLVTDDKHPADLLNNGHIDDMIRTAVSAGRDPVTCIRMATLWAAEAFGLKRIGAVAPGYTADLLVLHDLEHVVAAQVYKNGEIVAENGAMTAKLPTMPGNGLMKEMCNTFHIRELTPDDFTLHYSGKKNCRVMKLVKGQLITEELITEIDFDKDNGADISRDIAKIAVWERHRNTGHCGLGFISGLGMKTGAIASSVSHDSHNLIVAGVKETDMALAANTVRAMGGGCTVVKDGKVLCKMPLPVAGLMTAGAAADIASQNESLRKCVHRLGVPEGVEPFMTTAFVSLPVIPHLKMTTCGLVDVDAQKRVDLTVG